MIRIVVLLSMLAVTAQAATVAITVPDAFATSARATALCTFFANKHNVDSLPTRKLCLEAIVRRALLQLALDKSRSTIIEDARQDARNESDAIKGQWPPVLDLKECGDGELDTGEECDDGVSNSDTLPDACRTSCRNAFCGDGVVDTGEICDGTALCAPDCLSVLPPDPNAP